MGDAWGGDLASGEFASGFGMRDQFAGMPTEDVCSRGTSFHGRWRAVYG